jgi:hypothetical protein
VLSVRDSFWTSEPTFAIFWIGYSIAEALLMWSMMATLTDFFSCNVFRNETK